MQQIIDIGTPDDDTSGDEGRVAFQKVKSNFADLTVKAQVLAGTSPRQFVTFIGDSIGGYLMGSQGDDIGLTAASPFFDMFARHYNAALDMNTGGGYAYGAPGKKSDFILADRVPAMRAWLAAGNLIPHIVVVSSGQNDGVVRLDIAQKSFANITETVRQVLAMGVTHVILVGMLPDPKLTGPDRPYALDWLNTSLLNWASAQPGVAFLNVLPHVKDLTGAAEVQGNLARVQWRIGIDADGNPTQKMGSYEQLGLSGIGSTGQDNEHPSMMFGRLLGEPLSRIMRHMVGEMQMPDLLPLDFDKTRNPNGNYLGTRGLFMGTGGTLNGVASENVAAGWNLTFPASIGITVTPSIVVDARGIRRQRLTWGGTPTGAGNIELRSQFSALADPGGWMLTGYCDKVAEVGVSGLGLSGTRIGMGSIGGLSGIIPGSATGTEILRSPRATYFENASNQREFAWSTGVVQGVPISGSREYYKTAFVREFAL